MSPGLSVSFCTSTITAEISIFSAFNDYEVRMVSHGNRFKRTLRKIFLDYEPYCFQMLCLARYKALSSHVSCFGQ